MYTIRGNDQAPNLETIKIKYYCPEINRKRLSQLNPNIEAQDCEQQEQKETNPFEDTMASYVSDQLGTNEHDGRSTRVIAVA